MRNIRQAICRFGRMYASLPLPNIQLRQNKGNRRHCRHTSGLFFSRSSNLAYRPRPTVVSVGRFLVGQHINHLPVVTSASDAAPVDLKYEYRNFAIASPIAQFKGQSTNVLLERWVTALTSQRPSVLPSGPSAPCFIDTQLKFLNHCTESDRYSLLAVCHRQ